MNILNIKPTMNFLECLHNFIISKCENSIQLSNFTILLPSRRSCNELKKIFLENSKNEAIILPNIKAIGDVDYDDIFLKNFNKDDFEDYLNLSVNTSRIKYKIFLVKELLKWSNLSNKDIFKNATMEQITNLALELEKFLNEVARNNLNLDNLDDIVDDEYSKHWQEVLEFLGVFGKKWNNFIKENNIVAITEFKSKMIEFNAKYFENNKPDNPIIIAGVSGSIKSTCNLIKNLIKHDNCYFIFKGLDKSLTEEEWGRVGVFHPQYSFKKILKDYISKKRNDVADIEIDNKYKSCNANLEKILSYSMLTHFETYKWQENLNIKEEEYNNISKIECLDRFEEVNLISLITKYNYEKFNKTIAIITNDENFANQLEVKLNSMNVKNSNTFGNKISRTEFVKYLFLILDILKNNYEAIPLLSLLKHNFTLLDYDKSKLNKLILMLEDDIFRKFGNINYKKIKEKIKENKNTELINFFDKVYSLVSSMNFDNINFQDILKKHIEIAEILSSNSQINSKEIFWENQENGKEILNFFNELIEDSVNYGEINSCNEYSYLLNYLIAENSYNDKYSIHPIVNIISAQEAKLINYDLVILTNLNEGEFPAYISTDPWMSKSMRYNFGLPEKEEIVGSLAYDFTQFLCNKEVILTRSIKKDGTPTTKSKYLLRLETFLLCQNKKIEENNIWKEVYKDINRIEEFKVISRPKPTPPLEKRPKILYATKIEKLMNNPYDIYAEKVLNLKEKEDFNSNKVFAFFGSAVHLAIEKYIINYEKLDKEKLFEALIKYGKEAFDEIFTDDISKELFFIRFTNIAKWFIEEDSKIRQEGYKIYAEKNEKLYIEDLDFTIGAKIDRIEEKDDIEEVNIVDYKTGNPPSATDVLKGEKPQLTIGAIILKSKNKKVGNIAYWSIKGKEKDFIQNINCDDFDVLMKKTEEGVYRLISYFKVYENSYIATAYDLTNQNSFESPYKHLSRVEEWGYL